MTWFIQIQDKDGKVLLLNESVGNYKKYSKFVDNAANKIVAQFPTAHRWEVRPESFTSKVILWHKPFPTNQHFSSTNDIRSLL